jgi:chromosome partitioning protein
MPVTVFANQSGGAGKTTSAVALAVILAQRGQRVLLLDADQQRDASKILGYRDPDSMPNQANLNDVLIGDTSLPEAIMPARYRVGDDASDDSFEPVEGLDLVLGSTELAAAEKNLVRSVGPEFWLLNALDDVDGQYDQVLVDCPASLGTLMVGILVATENVVGCVKPGMKEISALTELEGTIALVKDRFGKRAGSKVELRHVLVCELPGRNQGRIYTDSDTQARATYGEKVLTAIPRDVRVPEAYSNQIALPIYDPEGLAATAYQRVATEMGHPEPASSKVG